MGGKEEDSRDVRGRDDREAGAWGMSRALIEPLQADDALLADIRSVAVSGSRCDVWWLGQSGFLCVHDGVHLLFDPYLSDSLTDKYANTDKPHVRMSRRTIDPVKLDFVDIVTSTHAHTDHLDAATLNPMLMSNPTARFVFARATAGVVDERLRAEVVHVPINVDETVTLDGATIHAVPAAHDKIDTDAAGNHRYLGFVVNLGPFTIYHSGDGVVYDGMVERLKKFGRIDLAILPINGKVNNMNGIDAARLAKAIGAKLAVPCHYHLFEFNTAEPAEQFVPECERLHQPYRVLRLGERLSLHSEPT
jgi:L-ascorbate metabolism protein UlaG (beta-lactamase superfamily)